MTRLSTKQARELGIDIELGKIRKKKKDQDCRHFQQIPTEREVLRDVRDYLQKLGWFVFRIHQSFGSHKGISDLIAVKNGQVLFIECKSQRKNAKQSKEQKEFQRQIEEHGGVYKVIRGIEDLEEVVHSAD